MRAPNIRNATPIAHTLLKISPSLMPQISFGPQKTRSRLSNAFCVQSSLSLTRACYFSHVPTCKSPPRFSMRANAWRLSLRFVLSPINSWSILSRESRNTFNFRFILCYKYLKYTSLYYQYGFNQQQRFVGSLQSPQSQPLEPSQFDLCGPSFKYRGTVWMAIQY